MDNISQTITPILKSFGIPKAAIFGSYARGEQTKESDIDILIMPTEEMSLFDFFDVRYKLEDVLQIKVDLVSYRGINKYIKDNILRDQVVLYEEQ